MRLSRLSIVAAIALFGLSGCVDAYPAVEGKFERTLKVTGPVDLDVSTGSGKIEVRAGSSSVVRIYGLIKARDDWRSSAQEKVRYLEANPPIEQSGNSIRIGRIDEGAFRNNVSISYEIETPADTRLNARTGSGSQMIEGLRGPVEVSTGSGSIEVDSISGAVDASTGSGSIRAMRVAGSIKARTGSGGITLEQTAPERGAVLDVEASTGSGSIEVSGVNGTLRASTGSGGITAGGNPAGEWKVHTSSGSVMLHLAPGAAFDLYARTSSGRINVDHPVTVMGGISKNEIRGTVRGGGRLVDVRTSSGGITIR